MSREKTLVKNTAILSIGKICTSAITFLLLPLYTGVLSTKEYGIVDLLNTLLSLLVPIITLQIEKAVFRELIDNRENDEKKKAIVSTSIIVTVVQCIIFVILFQVSGIFFPNEYGIFLEINIISYVILSILQQISRGLGKMASYAVSSFIDAAFTIIFNILFLVIFKMNVYGMLLGTFLGYICATLYLLLSLNLLQYLKTRLFSKKLFKDFLKYSIPLVPNALAWWIFSASDRVIVSSILGLDQNGIIAATLKFSTIIITIYTIFDTSWIESVSASIDDDDVESYFNKIFNAVLMLFASLGVIVISFMPIIFPLMINDSYSDGYWLIPITILSSFFNVMQGMVAVVFAAKKDTKDLSKTSVIAAIINIVVHLALIRFIGIYASVLSTLIALIVMCIYRIISVNRKFFKIKLNKKNAIMVPLFFAIIAIIYYMNNPVINILSMVTSVVFVMCVNIQYIDVIKKFLLRKAGMKNGK